MEIKFELDNRIGVYLCSILVWVSILKIEYSLLKAKVTPLWVETSLAISCILEYLRVRSAGSRGTRSKSGADFC